MRVLGHRGARMTAPENTVEAFKAALALGADGVELDVRRTADGVLVCFHDAGLERTTDGTGPLSRRTLAELRLLDAGARFEVHGRWPLRGTGIRIPTLAEALDAMPAARIVNVEVKPFGQGGIPLDVLADEVRRTLAIRPDLDRVLVSSFSRRLAALLAGALGPQRAGLVTTTFVPLGRAVRAAHAAGCGTLVAQAPTFLRPGAAPALARAHALGTRLAAWTVDDPGVARRLAELGVWAVISDRPDVLRAAGC
jgi:glycerophosphoryl diester phosphodiesterase